MRKMIAYCGLDCEKCDAYLATVHDDQASRRYGKVLPAPTSCASSVFPPYST